MRLLAVECCHVPAVIQYISRCRTELLHRTAQGRAEARGDASRTQITASGTLLVCCACLASVLTAAPGGEGDCMQMGCSNSENGQDC